MDEVRYQVFVSSTFTDLKEEREKVLQAILQRKAFPAGMELFPAADEEQFEFIKREIASSDYYVVIIAGRYGSVDNDGVSFTEKEYDYAKERGKPILAFLHRDIGKLIGDKLESTDEAKENLRAFRAKASVVRQADCRLFRDARARLTFSRMSAALAVQMKGFGFSLCWSM